nr:inactive ubiquitin carboxyl-terminal hydrolase MINDY-4B-like [Ciona intestinalis]|eukprot:XP_002122244.1 inactive ubiquitin carboxyl-terminal hydrolase MINDY-4B-like [Ciona intestinalis]
MDSRDITSKTKNSNLVKLANALDYGLQLPFQTQVTTKAKEVKKSVPKSEFIVPKHGPKTQTKNHGRPIDLTFAKALRVITIGFSSQSFTSDWRKFYFAFRETKSAIPYAMDATMPGPRALTLCMQAYIMKHLLFTSDQNNDSAASYFGKSSPTPSSYEQECALVEAITDVLWKAATTRSDKGQVTVTLMGSDPCFETKGSFIADGFTEKLWIYTINSKNETKKFIRRNVHYFNSRKSPGGILLLYSVVLSRTIDVLLKDFGRKQTSLLTDNARSTQSLINLLLTGQGSPFIHNGVVRTDSKGKALDRPLAGLRCRSEMGFLFFNKNEPEKKRTQVGSMYKTPLLPIWVTQVNGSYGVLFCTARDLVTDWKTERYFCLHYYNGHFTQQAEATITIDTRTRVDSIDLDRQISIWDDDEEIEKKQPSLEQCLHTKWPESNIDWNGETPFY